MLPKVNQYVYMQVASSFEEEAAVEYRSRISEVKEQHILIEIPMNESTGKLKKLYLGDELSIYFITDGGVKNYFYSHVLGFQEDVIRLVSIQRPDPEQITKIQRRNFLRVSAELELAVKASNRMQFIAHTDDIGGGGVSYIAEGRWNVKVGDKLACWLLVPYKNGTLDHAQFESEVVRVNPLQTGRTQVMSKFVAISDGERQKIIRYCFERQLEFRNR
ncbi:glycosyl transferase [Paenibacillaceae bacterium]|nr:glycosyl transferase [Paenibacillaceae bacterium]